MLWLPMARAVRKIEILARQHDRLIAEARGQEVSPDVIEEAEANARTWLASLALGIAAFGVYCFSQARYRKV